MLGTMSEPMTAEQIARYIVAEAVWAPSVHNTQPWRFIAGSEPGRQHASAPESRIASRSACTPTPTAGWPRPILKAAS